MKEPANRRGMLELADGQYRPDTDREGQQRSGPQRTNQLPAARQSLAREPSQVHKVREYDVIERVYLYRIDLELAERVKLLCGVCVPPSISGGAIFAIFLPKASATGDYPGTCNRRLRHAGLRRKELLARF